MDLDIAGGDIMYLILLFAAFVGVLYLIERLRSRKTLLNRENNYPYIPKEMDNDVESEKSLVQNANPSDYTVLVRNLRKVFIQNNG